MHSPLKILNHHIFYHPELVGVAAYAGQMCSWLARHGHCVRVVCPPPYYPYWSVQQPYKAWRYQSEVVDGVHVTRCPIWVPARPQGTTRALYEGSFALTSMPALLGEMRYRPDVIFVTQPSFLNAIVSLMIGTLFGAACWMHVQDFELDIAFDLAHFRSRSRRLVRAIESFVLRRFDVVSTISGRMMERLAEKGVAEERRVLFPNWVDTDEIFPMRRSPLRDELHIPDDVIVVLYTGSMGAKQGIEQLVQAARLLSRHPSIQFVIGGEGPALSGLQASARDLRNTRFLPLQPPHQLNALLNLADVHVLPQRQAVADSVMPSKLIGMLASGRPVVASAPAGSEVAKVVSRCGVAVTPEDPVAMAEAILELATDEPRRHLLGQIGRNYAVANFRKDAILEAFETQLRSLTK